MEYRQFLQSSWTGHGTAPQVIQFSPPPLISRASDGHPAILSLLFSSLSLSLTAETLDIHWLTLPPASILFHSPWRLSAICCIVIPPTPSNHSAEALIWEHSLTAEALGIHWLTFPPAPTLLHLSGLWVVTPNP